MCDGKHSSKRDVVILSIKPKRPDFPSNQKLVPVTELLQEWDKLDAYYRGQLLKLTKSLTKRKSSSKRSRIQGSDSVHSAPDKVRHSSSKSSPVNKNHSSSLSSDQFTELFGDENLFANNNDSISTNRHNKHNKLLHSRSLNNLFEDSLDGIAPQVNSRSRKNSLTNANTNLVVSIPILSVPNNCGDNNNYNYDKKRKRYIQDNDDDNQTYLSEEDEEEKELAEEARNFLSVPRDNFQVQYGTKQKTRVALLEAGGVSPRWIVPVHVAPYKPPTAQGLNGVQIQKILYHKNDSINYASPTTTTARTPDKPPDNMIGNPSPPATKSAKVSVSSNSPMSTVSPRSTTSSGTTTTSTSPIGDSNNNATPKQTTSRTPDLSSPKTEQGSAKFAGKLSSPPVNSTSGSKLKRPISMDSQNGYVKEKKQRLSEERATTTHGNLKTGPVTSSSSSGYSSSASSVGDASEIDNHGSSQQQQRISRKETKMNSVKEMTGSTEKVVSPKKLNIISKNPSFLKTATGGDLPPGPPVFLPPPPGLSITDRIIKKASMPQPELLERQRRRRMESNQRKSYAMQKGDEHEEKESIELSMKSFEMIWNIPLLSPLRSP